MIITCEQCKAKYSIADKFIGPKGKMVRCNKCEHTWMACNISYLPNNKNNITSNHYEKIGNYLHCIQYTLIIILFLISFIFFPNLWNKIKPLEEIYQYFGIYSSQGIIIDKLDYQLDKQSIKINGKIINLSNKPRKIPLIRYRIKDRDNNKIFQYTENNEELILNPGDYLKINKKIINLNVEDAILQIDIGNKLELFLK